MSYYLEVEKQKVSLRVTTSKMKNQSFTSSTKSNWKNEKFQSELLIRKNKNKKKKIKKIKNLDFKLYSLMISLFKWNITQFRNIWKDYRQFGFCVTDLDLALSRYCLWSWDYLTHSLRYSTVLLKLQTTCFA